MATGVRARSWSMVSKGALSMMVLWSAGAAATPLHAAQRGDRDTNKIDLQPQRRAVRASRSCTVNGLTAPAQCVCKHPGPIAMRITRLFRHATSIVVWLSGFIFILKLVATYCPMAAATLDKCNVN